MSKTVSLGIWILLLYFGFGALFTAVGQVSAQSRPDSTYVGSAACQDCHQIEYENYRNFAKKARSFESIERMRSRLTQTEFHGCLECHTTGYGRPGGFRSEQESPDLKNAGCEVCHGPGSRHVATADAGDIKGKLTLDDCETCHNQERVEAFGFKPMVYGGGH